MPYAIAELRADQAGGYAPRGAARDLWRSRDFETILSGPAETGKTWGCLQYADALLWKYPGAQGVMSRKTYASLIGSALRTYQRIAGQSVKAFGKSKPEWFDYPNGSRLWIVGLDNPGKALSSERDFIYVNQAEELTPEDWLTLTTRATGRGSVMPYTRMFGDCNPGPPTHWIKHRQGLRLLESRHEDNPALFDDNGRITEQGKRTMAILDSLTGVLRERLRFGRWVQAEGVIYEGYSAAVHLIDRFPIPNDWPRLLSIDWGYNNPFVAGWWAVDPDGRLIRYREIYMTKRLVEDHARQILEVSAGESAPVAVICDHDLEDRMTFERHTGWETTPAYKESVDVGLQLVMARLRVAGDGKPRLMLMRDSLVEVDQSLLHARKPTCTEQEFDLYVWDTKQGKRVGEKPLKEHDHGMDQMRYLVAAMDADGDDDTTNSRPTVARIR